VGLGEPLLHEHVVRRLELLDVLELGVDAQLIQPVFEKGHPAADAVDSQPAERLKDDPVAGGRQIVFLVELGRLLDVGINLFARPSEVQDGVTNLAGLGPLAPEFAQPDEDAAHPAVHFGLPEVLPDIVHRDGPAAQEEGRQRVGLGELGK
jgi:hypothetical protein